LRADAKRKRQAIINAATQQYRTVPEGEITLEGIAKDAGVGIATLYRHFPTHEDLRLACAMDLIAWLEEFFTVEMDTFDQAPERNWERIIWTLVDNGLGMLIAALAPKTVEGESVEVARKRNEVIGLFGQLLRKASSHGLVSADADPLEVAAEMIVVTRPQPESVNDLFPDVRNRLVQHLLKAWRQPVQRSEVPGP
jgi:AcrR family transcriptional regulator